MRKFNSARRKRDNRGVVAIEFVLIFPFLVALIFAIAQFGIFFSKKVSVESAARDAARYLALNPESTSPPVPIDMEIVPGSVTPCPKNNNTLDAVIQLRLKDGGYTFAVPGLSLGKRQVTVTGKMRCAG